MRDFRDEVRWLVEMYNENPEFTFGAYLEPHKMLDFMAATELGEDPMMELFRPGDLALKSALALQHRANKLEYSLVRKLTNSNINELCVDAEDVVMYGNSGVVFSIIYNLMKNAWKKSSGKANNNDKIFTQVYEAPLSSVVITVGDNGTPIDLNKMKTQVRELIKERGIESVVFPNMEAKKRYEGWQQSEYKVGDLTMRDITDVAFMARMSGFDNDEHFSSGLGLYGLSYFVEKLGGIALYGENFETGSPIFTCILPKKMKTGGIRRVLNLLASTYNESKLYRNGYCATQKII